MPPKRAYRKRNTAPMRRRRAPTQYAGKRKWVVHKSIPTQTHVFKRYADPLRVVNLGQDPPSIYSANGTWNLGTVVTDIVPGTSQFGLTANFQLRDVLNHTEFTNLYDRYKILGVKLKFMYQSATAQDQLNLGTGSVGYNNVLPIMDHTFDIDDSDATTITKTGVQQHAYCKTQIFQANQPFKKYMVPRASSKIKITDTVVGDAVLGCSVWLDCSHDDAPHYGLKAWLSSWPYNSTPGANQQASGCLTIQPIFYLAFRDSQ